MQWGIQYAVGMQYALGMQYTVGVGAKRSTHTVDLANMGDGGIVFDTNRSNQWIQWMQSHSSTQWMQYAVDTVE